MQEPSPQIFLPKAIFGVIILLSDNLNSANPPDLVESYGRIPPNSEIKRYLLSGVTTISSGFENPHITEIALSDLHSLISF